MPQIKAIVKRFEENSWAGCDAVTQHLQPEGVYEVAKIEVHSMHTRIHLTDFPGMEFNSVMFDFIPADAVDKACEEWRAVYFSTGAKP